MTPEARDEVVSSTRTVLAALSGVAIRRVTAQYTEDRVWRVDVDATAWSPGLYGMEVRWTAHVDHSPTLHRLFAWVDRASLRGRLRRALAGPIALQAARAARGRRLGIRAPLELPSPATAASTPDSMRIDHLVVDRQALRNLVAAIARTQGTAGALRAPLDRQIAFDAASAHEPDPGKPAEPRDGRVVSGVNLIRKLPVSMREVAGLDGTESLLQAHFGIGTGSTAASFDGTHLIVLAPIPETLLTACVGRTVGDVVATGTPVDGRTITDARLSGQSSIIATVPDAVRVRDLPEGIVTLEDISALERAA